MFPVPTVKYVPVKLQSLIKNYENENESTFSNSLNSNSCRPELNYFSGKKPKNRPVCKNAVTKA